MDPATAKRCSLAFAVIFAAACAQDFEFEAWVLPLPADVGERIGYRPVVAAGVIELVEDLVIGGSGAAPAASFGRAPPRLAVAEDETLFVLDASNHRLQVFGPAGGFRGTIGRRGQGPGEFGQPVELFVRGDVVHVWDVVNRRVSRFALDGSLIEDRTTGVWGGMIVADADGTMVWRQSERTADGTLLHIRRVNAAGEETLRYATLPWPVRTIDPPFAQITNTEPDAWWTATVPPAFAAAADGTVYVTSFADYQVFAYEPNGILRWALQVAVERPPVSRAEIDFHMSAHRRRFPERTAEQIDWPEREYALADLKVDGHGHLYVFPYVAKGSPTSTPRRVDVYDDAGRRLFSGELAGRMFEAASATYNGPMYEVAWQVARGDVVWGVARTEDSEDWQVLRYRLIEPF